MLDEQVINIFPSFVCLLHVREVPCSGSTREAGRSLGLSGLDAIFKRDGVMERGTV